MNTEFEFSIDVKIHIVKAPGCDVLWCRRWGASEVQIQTQFNACEI